ncbi:MAG: ammonium transporter [Akkermansiaceae bacterium]
MRTLTAAAIVALAVPLSFTAHAQDEAPPPPPTEEVVEATPAEPVVEPAAEAAEDEHREAYDELLAAQGDHAYAFDFFTTSMLWTVIAAAMVFIMHLGFATLEAGLTQRKNTVNILFKNVFIICIGLLTYAFVGFNTHYPGDFNGWFKIGGPIGDLNAEGGDTFGYGGVALAMTGFGDFIFQAMFAATAATIVSGAVAERVKLPSFMIFSTLLVAFGYTIAGSWHWGGGWLSALGGGDAAFKDFAGSTVVHGFGGAAALACVLLLGARRGKYTKDGIKPILGHSMPLAAIGVFLLFFGWFGFNGGSVLSAAPGPLGLVFTTTALAAAAGGVSSMLFSWIILKKPDLSMALNGLLAGLVSITAAADSVSAMSSIVMGAIGGVIVVGSILFFDKIKVDDPVGAISVHGVCGIWGTLAVAIFGEGFSMMSQIIGVLAIYSFAFVFSFVVFFIIKLVMGIRVDAQEESEGLDVAEHGVPAYNDH